jgi:uncharacterized membrane protein
MKIYWIAIAVVFVACIIGALGSIFLKKGADKFKMSVRELLHNKNLIIGVLLLGLGFLLSVPMLKFVDLSILYPLTALTYVWVCFFSIRYLSERMNRPKWIGVFLILLGAILIV